MIRNFKVTDKKWSGIFVIMDKVIYEDHLFDDNGTRDANLRQFLLELLTFNLEWFIQGAIKRRDKMNFREREALDILVEGNKWFIDNRYQHKLILDTFERVKRQIDDCCTAAEDRGRRELLYEQYDMIKKWFEYTEKI